MNIMVIKVSRIFPERPSGAFRGPTRLKTGSSSSGATDDTDRRVAFCRSDDRTARPPSCLFAAPRNTLCPRACTSTRRPSSAPANTTTVWCSRSDSAPRRSSNCGPAPVRRGPRFHATAADPDSGLQRACNYPQSGNCRGLPNGSVPPAGSSSARIGRQGNLDTHQQDDDRRRYGQPLYKDLASQCVQAGHQKPVVWVRQPSGFLGDSQDPCPDCLDRSSWNRTANSRHTNPTEESSPFLVETLRSS